MKWTVLSFIFITLNSLLAQTAQENILTDPLVSERCKELLGQRQYKINLKQKSVGLEQRVKKILRDAPKNRKSVHMKLNKILKKISREKDLLEYQIANLEEVIVRKGCPGILL